MFAKKKAISYRSLSLCIAVLISKRNTHAFSTRARCVPLHSVRRNDFQRLTLLSSALRDMHRTLSTVDCDVGARRVVVVVRSLILRICEASWSFCCSLEENLPSRFRLQYFTSRGATLLRAREEHAMPQALSSTLSPWLFLEPHDHNDTWRK